MSEPIASTYVEIRPELAPNFEQDLRAQVQKDVDAATARVKAKLSPRQFSMFERTGGLAALQRTTALNSELRATQALAAAQEAAAIKSGRFATGVGSVAGRLGLYGLAVGAVLSGTRQLADALEVTGQKADTLEGSLRNLGAAALKGDFATAAKNLGQSAALAFQPGARGAAREAGEAAQREADVQKAIALTAEYVKVREQAAKATGQVGTAEGVVKFQLEQQLRILKAQVGALSPAQRRVGFAQLGLSPTGGTSRRAQEAIEARKAGARPTNLDFALRAARAAQTKTAADDLALYQSRADYLRGLIRRQEKAGADTEAAKGKLKDLYGQLDDAEGQISSLQKDALARRQERLQEQISLRQTELQIAEANARTDSAELAAQAAQANYARQLAGDKRLDKQARAGYALQAAQIDKQIFQANQAAAEEAKRAAEERKRQHEQELKDAQEKARQARQIARQTRELALENAIARAGLTKRNLDDLKAVKAQVAYFRNLVKNTKGLEREQARSQLISARGQLQELRKTRAGGGQAQGATVGEFFQEAVRQFAEFGSNIAQRGGILSGQDARGAFALRALSGAGSAEVKAQVTRIGQLTESQKQTAILQGILNAVGGKPSQRQSAPQPSDTAIRASRLGVGAGVGM